jgi:hypothetical protein
LDSVPGSQLILAGSLALAQGAPPPKEKPSAKSTPQRETVAKPLTEKERKRREAKLRKELEGPYRSG